MSNRSKALASHGLLYSINSGATSCKSDFQLPFTCTKHLVTGTPGSPDLKRGAQRQRVARLTKTLPLHMVPFTYPGRPGGREAKQLESSKSPRCVVKFKGIHAHPKQKPELGTSLCPALPIREYKKQWEWHPYVPQIYTWRIRYVEILYENKHMKDNYFLGRKAELETRDNSAPGMPGPGWRPNGGAYLLPYPTHQPPFLLLLRSQARAGWASASSAAPKSSPYNSVQDQLKSPVLLHAVGSLT